jgi:hypothetical protein
VSIPLQRATTARPKTTEAVLFCEKEKNFTHHVFSKIEEVKAESGHRQMTKFIYNCACGASRVWGSED